MVLIITIGMNLEFVKLKTVDGLGKAELVITLQDIMITVGNLQNTLHLKKNSL